MRYDRKQLAYFTYWIITLQFETPLTIARQFGITLMMSEIVKFFTCVSFEHVLLCVLRVHETAFAPKQIPMILRYHFNKR